MTDDNDSDDIESGHIEFDEVPEAVRVLLGDKSEALRAPKTVDDPQAPDDARTAVRYVGDDFGVPQFQVVSTKCKSFPRGKDMVNTHSIDTVVDWATKNDIEEIGVADEPGFEPTDYALDPLGERENGTESEAA